ncbi:MAG TPA: hypothetical protein VG826_09475 [Pirellulales bacterium]|nr:hypothetical protein [Pirellulales bacterium]
MEQRLRHQLEKVATRFRRLRFWRSLATAWLSAAAVGLVLLALNRFGDWYLPSPVAVVCGLAIVGAGLCLWAANRRARDYRWVAQRVEAAYPELKSCLFAAMEQRPTLPGGRFGFLQDRVIRQALNHAYGHPWPGVVPSRRFAAALVANLAGAALLMFVLAELGSRSFGRSGAAESVADGRPHAAGQLSVTVEPGDTEVERGTSLLVLARFQGGEPTAATLVYQPGQGEPTRQDMARSLDDPVFGGRIAVVDEPLDYRVELADHISDTYHVTVFEYPSLVQADAKLVYPQYTGLEERLVQDVRTVSAVEGTELTLLCHLNKPVVSATLTEADAEPITLAAVDDDPLTWQVTIRCEKSRRLRLNLVDDRGRTNKHPIELSINVLPNKPPDLRLASYDVEVSPLEETEVKATAWDDFGLARFGLTYKLAGGVPTEVVLGEKLPAKRRHEMAHMIRFEDLKAQPDQLLSYHFWAEDAGPDGAPRRTESDMYFAEVRPFEEIFRQGQQPPGGSQQQEQQGAENAQAAEKLSQLQKEIIAATWKLVRRELPAEPSNAFGGDVQLIHDSQAEAQEQAESLAEELSDPQSKAYAGEVTRAMQQALDLLRAAHEGPAVEPLRSALVPEEAAYEALLKLRAREHNVIRSQRGGGGRGGAAGRSQQQLQQLELKNDENRYENQRTAQSAQPQERETRQVLNRLSELARRQSDLNERLKELQSALEEAKSEEKREEIRRQLKRLREEEQEILRDTDELKARMEQPENQERMADAREQLDQTRDQLRRTSEALEQEMVSQAAAAGTRAERDFQELRNEFRRRTSGQFTDQMREMRDDARKLDEQESEIAQRMSEPNGQETRSLREDTGREKIPGELAQQKERLAELLNRMRQTIEEAEATEPLLAEQLYDTARKVEEQNLERALEAAELSVRRGLNDDAREQERIAGKGIGQLRQGIERAAESVLGDDTEALRRAREELDRLADQLADEIARNTGEGVEENEPNDGGPRGEGLSPQDAEPSSNERRTRGGSQEAGEREPSSRSRGDQSAPDQQRSANPSRSGNSPQSQGRPESPDNQGGAPQPGPNQDQQEPGGAQAEERQQEQNGQQGQAGQQGQSGEGEQAGQRGSQRGGGSNPPDAAGGQSAERRGAERGGSERQGDLNSAGAAAGGFAPFFEPGNRPWAPLAGEDFRDWSDRLRDVEEMVDDPELRAEAARIRQRAGGIRAELKRHSKEPNWNLVKIEVSRPLYELRDRVAEELLRRTSKDALLPLDRDPVPPKYSEKTRRYYERLGTGR